MHTIWTQPIKLDAVWLSPLHHPIEGFRFSYRFLYWFGKGNANAHIGLQNSEGVITMDGKRYWLS
jgi:hypothetical protein